MSTPIDSRGKLFADGTAIDDASSYRSLTGALMYLTIMHLDLAFVMQQACLHMYDPRAPHMTMLKRILRYVQGTKSHDLHLRVSPTLDITAYFDADWAGCPKTQRSTLRFCIFLGESLVSWSSKHQPMVSCSSTEAEYRAIANAAVKCIWLCQLLGKLHCHLNKATVAYCDNISVVAEHPSDMT
ncbi:uncharacterized mitochondrial protein AtMg00810-like [Miscanthus floridulus]|uniref:uncharacterized mitochondrial protein AtMg00810-like n=1 Tax=Miscanthus floridulus TaxID=154761 RepID=UPI00345AD460